MSGIIVKTKKGKHSALGGKITRGVILCSVTCILFMPLIALLLTSFKSANDLMFHAESLFPKEFTFNNYYRIFNLEGAGNLNFYRSIGNTAFITVINIAGVVLTSSLAGYGFMRFKVKINGILFGLLMAGMFIPGQVLQIPIYEIYFKLNWIDTFLPMTVTAFLGGGIFNIFLMREFFRGIPPSMFEAAEIDGAGELRMFLTMVIPLSVPVLLTIAIFTFQGAWNDFYSPLLYLRKPERFTIALAVYQFSINTNRYTGELVWSSPWNLISAINILAMLPMFIVYILCQRYFIEGIALGGIKG